MSQCEGCKNVNPYICSLCDYTDSETYLGAEQLEKEIKAGRATKIEVERGSTYEAIRIPVKVKNVENSHTRKS